MNVPGWKKTAAPTTRVVPSVHAATNPSATATGAGAVKSDAFDTTSGRGTAPALSPGQRGNGPVHARMQTSTELVGGFISGADRQLLTKYRFDAPLHGRRRAAVKAKELTPAASMYQGKIEAPPPGKVECLPAVGSVEEARLRERGERALRDGKVAVVVLAGGMATRFQGVP